MESVQTLQFESAQALQAVLFFQKPAAQVVQTVLEVHDIQFAEQDEQVEPAPVT